jgi:phosphatidylglycerol---prolipoprotein diacylglyceryl transferase
MYGLLISTGILAALLVAEKLVEQAHMRVEVLWNSMIFTLIFSLIGARMYHVLDFWEYYAVNPLRSVQIWRGGLGIFGALLGGALSLGIYLKIKHENIFKWFDVACVVIPLGQAIGRWGNFFNQELFGPPTTLLWGTFIKPKNRPKEYASFSKFHPLFLYESLANFVLFLLLYFSYRKDPTRVGSGRFVWFYLIGYSTIRFFLEFLKLETRMVGRLSVVQIICMVLVIGSTLAMGYKTKKPRNTA